MTTIAPTIVSKLIDLIPVAAGALIAFAGSGIKYLVDVRDRRKQIKREKLERLLRVAHELMDWTSQVEDRYIFGKQQVEVVSIMDEMVVLASLYFPELANEVHAIVLSSKRYKGLAVSIGNERLAKGTLPTDHAERMDAAYSPLVDAIEALTLKAEEQAARLL